jgi:hypothetical protein
MIRRISLAVLAATFLSAAATAQEKPAAGEKRTLTFHRAETKGAKYELSAKGSLLRTSDVVTDSGRRPAAEALNLQVTFEGELEVTSVTPKAGRWSELKITVKRMSITDGSTEEESPKAGAVITAVAEKTGTTILIDGKAPAEKVETAVKVVLPPLVDVDEPVTDVFAAPGPVAPGEEWKPDKKRFATLFSSLYRTTIDPDKSTAAVRYKGPATVAGQECDTVVSSFRAVFTKLEGLPEGSKFKSATVTSDSTDSMPRDVKIASALHGKGVMDFEASFEMNAGGNQLDIVSKTHQELQVTLKPLK